jgi:hypothetical protein
MENPRHLGHHDKTKTIMGVEEGEEKQTKGMDKLFNRIIVENFQNHEIKKSHPGSQSLQTMKLSKTKRNTPRYIIIKTLSI